MKWHSDWVRKYSIDGFRVDGQTCRSQGLEELKENASAAFCRMEAPAPSAVLSNDFLHDRRSL